MNASLNLLAGWCAFVVGAAGGAILGLSFNRPGYLGGYGSWRRRLLRLGHIACFGMGMLNILFALSVRAWPLGAAHEAWASAAWLVALVAMPVCCALAAWRERFRHLFPIPVAATLVALVALLSGWWNSIVASL
jgi:hypothetical protein